MVDTKEEAFPSDTHGAEPSGDKKVFSGGKAFKKKTRANTQIKRMKGCPSY